MPDERPEENAAPRFGRRPRQGAAAAPGSGDAQAPRPKMRIGPRRKDASASGGDAAAGYQPLMAPRDPEKPMGGVRKAAREKAQAQAQKASKQQGARDDRRQGGKRRKRGRDKFRQKEDGVRDARPDSDDSSAQGDLFAGEGAGIEAREPDAAARETGSASDAGSGEQRQGQGRNARRRKRRKERRDATRQGDGAPARRGAEESDLEVFEPAHDIDMPSSDDAELSFEEDDSDLNLVELPPPAGDRDGDDADEDDDDDDGDDPASDPAVGEFGAPAASAPTRESRSKRRRKKRRERMEAAIVDRASGFWWADQWTRSFEVLYGGGASRARLQKGRSYSRRGQVTELEVGPNGVIARVQGSRPKPYQVRVELNRLRRETWGRILHQLAGKAAFLAQLLEGTLPPEIEDVFFDAGARLFPHGDNDVRSRCTCPDPVVPCKHVAAVHYALAEALQRDPFLLFALRGKSRDQFLQDLREMRGRDGARREPAAPSVEDLGRFWRMGRLAESVLRPTGWGSGGDPARLVQSLGEPQLEGIREGLFLPMLESTYRQVSEGMRRLPKDG